MQQMWQIYSEASGSSAAIPAEELLKLARNGTINKNTYVRTVDEEGWHLAGSIEGLFHDEPELTQNSTPNIPDTSASSTSASSPPALPPGYGPSNNDAPVTTSSFDDELLDDELISCPHCWSKFSLSKTLYISRHPDLTDDNGRQVRFLPRKFTPQGLALDEHDTPCPDMACPSCEQKVPKTMIEHDPFIVSIVGAPASGKSYFLASMIWNLRRELPSQFSLSLSDGDVQGNNIINSYQDLLFRSTEPEKPVLIHKTTLDAASGNSPYEQVMINGMPTVLPRPFIFTLKPTPTHPDFGQSEAPVSKNLVFYDNAGEHFQAGADTANSPGTQHIIHSEGIIFLFDPSKDAGMLRGCSLEDPQARNPNKTTDQSTLFYEMTSRFSKYGGVSSNTKHEKPVIIAVAKYDMWKDMLPIEVKADPWVYNEENYSYELDFQEILNVSYNLRELMLKFSPDLVVAAENFSHNVYFVPVSALGGPPVESQEATGQLMVRPADIAPIWATIPQLIIMAESKYIPSRRSTKDGTQEIKDYRLVNNHFVFNLPDSKARLQLPANYGGVSLFHPSSENWFALPDEMNIGSQQSQETQSFWDT